MAANEAALGASPSHSAICALALKLEQISALTIASLPPKFLCAGIVGGVRVSIDDE